VKILLLQNFPPQARGDVLRSGLFRGGGDGLPEHGILLLECYEALLFGWSILRRNDHESGLFSSTRYLLEGPHQPLSLGPRAQNSIAAP
jgi:hypothetical protein